MDKAKNEWVERVLGISVAARDSSAGAGQNGIATRQEAGKRCLETWLDAKDTADAGLSRLQAALKGSGDPAMLRIADGGLHAVSRGLQVGIRVALEEFARGADTEGKAAQKLSLSVVKFRQFLDSDPAVRLCDENPFGVDVSIRPALGQALNEVERQLKTVAQ